MSVKTIGIDIGTTTISAVVLDVEDEQILEARTIPNQSFIHTENSWERIQDVKVITCQAEKVLKELLMLHPDVSIIGLTGQMHGIVYVDSEGAAVSPLYTWQDGRGNLPLSDEYQGKSAVQLMQELGGARVYAGYGCATYFYHVCREMVPESAASFCTISDYLGMVLTGRKTPLVHASNAASLGMFDVKEGCFCVEQLKSLGVDIRLLPRTTKRMDVLGFYESIPVTVAVGDNQASFLGAAGMTEGTVLVNMGTGGQISVLTDQYFEAPGIEARPFIRGGYLLVGASLCGGRAYAILEQFFRSYLKAAGVEAEAQYPVMEQLASTVTAPDAQLRVTTTFSGTREEPTKRGSICGISEENFTPVQVIYGTLTGMADELFELYQTIQKGTGLEITKLIASGNGLRKNKLLRDIFSQLFDRELWLAQCEEEAACGAALSSTLFVLK